MVKGWPEAEKSWKKTPKISINYNSIVTSSMTSSLWVIPELKALHLKFWYSDFFDDSTTWWRSRAIWKIFVVWLYVATTWSNHLKIFVVASLDFYLVRIMIKSHDSYVWVMKKQFLAKNLRIFFRTGFFACYMRSNAYSYESFDAFWLAVSPAKRSRSEKSFNQWFQVSKIWKSGTIFIFQSRNI